MVSMGPYPVVCMAEDLMALGWQGEGAASMFPPHPSPVAVSNKDSAGVGIPAHDAALS